MATNNLLLTLHPLHPDWTAAQFAEVAGCDLSYVRKTFSLAGLKIKDSRCTVQEWRREKRPYVKPPYAGKPGR